MNNKTFHIGLTMAGAVSAGAYTGGVIDYLLETLEKWQQAKDKNILIKKEHPDDFINHGYDISIPMHDVVIDVMSGASAGGITAIIAAMGLVEGIDPYNDERINFLSKPDSKEADRTWHNKLYECWVDMVDDDNKSTFQKLLKIDDLKNKQNVESLLNSKVIEQIGEKAKQLHDIKNTLPPYISQELDIILSVSNLRGLKFNIDFETYGNKGEGTNITLHSGFFKYRIVPKKNFAAALAGSINKQYHVPNFNDEEDLNHLVQAARSTGAFPIGLSAIKSSIPSVKIKNYADELFNTNKGIKLITELKDENYNFISVDGGLINNEPFGFAHKAMKEKIEDLEKNDEHAIIMINPFPAFDSSERYDTDIGIVNIAKRSFKALRNQVMFKQDDLIDAINESNLKRFLISPSRKINGKAQEHPIACGALGGFSGFISKDFREHDFLLGRKNCRDFLRYHFYLDNEKANDVLGDWQDPAMERFKFYMPKGDKTGKMLLPIIPDLDVERAWDQKFKKEIKFDFPSINEIELDKNKALFSKRIKLIIKMLIPGSKGKGFFSKIKAFFIRMYMTPIRRGTKNMLTQKVMDIMKSELKKFGLLKS